MDVSTRLQIPDTSIAGPSQSSRQAGVSRPVSATVQPTYTGPNVQSHTSSPSARKRASHTVTSSQPQTQEQPIYRDVYSHPAAVAYAAAHHRRTIPKFGPYLLLQTLGEGEFGKVKLGLHGQWGEEVAVKLIRRGNIDTAVRMSKVEREIEVLRTIKHPNIVRLYDVIETDKYIGIILEYASGGELFDHILAHRYLKEKDACKLFAQLISGVWYIHQKKIVHRDLKLENLLLDRHRNVIITDFGFANRFEHRADDLMQTSCGSPCYAAPELVISEGLYVGSAVDIWSCGVILYAMLAGYLPFDDDPANPDGDNINLLYKYIVNTPLTFPDYVSDDARDILSMMLVPDPQRRAGLNAIMAHRWLAPYASLFDRDVQDLERAAMEQQQLKRLAYQRQMKQQAVATTNESSRIQRSQSARTDATPNARARHPEGGEYLYETSADMTLSSPPPVIVQQPNGRRQAASAIVMPTNKDDPFGSIPILLEKEQNLPSLDEVSAQGEFRDEYHTKSGKESATKNGRKPEANVASVKTTGSPERRRNDVQRHTLQVEYLSNKEETQSKQEQRDRERHQEAQHESGTNMINEQTNINDIFYTGVSASPNSVRSRRTTKSNAAAEGPVSTKVAKPLPTPPTSPEASSVSKKTQTKPRSNSTSAGNGDLATVEDTRDAAPSVSISPASTITKRETNADNITQRQPQYSSASLGSAGSGSSQSRHRKGTSFDKFVGKVFSGANGSETKLTKASANGKSSRISSDGHNGAPMSPAQEAMESEVENANDKNKDKARRRNTVNTLNVMVQPLGWQIRSRSKVRSVTGEVSPNRKERKTEPVEAKIKVDKDLSTPITPQYAGLPRPMVDSSDVPASTSKASKVMQWFRYKSKSRGVSDGIDEYENVVHPDADANTTINKSAIPTMYKENVGLTSPSGTIRQPSVHVVVTTPLSPDTPKPARSPSVSRHLTSLPSDTSMGQTGHVSLSHRAFNVLSNISAVANVPSFRTNHTFNAPAIRVHQGAVDQTTVTTGSPPDVMALVTKVLLDMGVEVQQETEFKYRCIRAKRKKSGTLGNSGNLAAFSVAGTAASNGVDKRGLPIPNTSGGGMLRGLLMRRQSSQVSTSTHSHYHGQFESDSTPASAFGPSASKEAISSLASSTPEPVYGDRTSDQGDEVRFSVELTKIDGLEGTFSLDIRRLKGNLRSYKFLYDTVRERCNLQR